MKAKLKEAQRLHEKAQDLLEMAVNMQLKIDKKLQYNLEIANPNGFKPYSDDNIDTCQRGLKRLYWSYQQVLMQIASL